MRPPVSLRRPSPIWAVALGGHRPPPRMHTDTCIESRP
jgi:hypothetical protein